MKPGLSLRRVLILIAAIAFIMPILLFAGIIQSRIWTLITRNVNTELESEVDTADQVISIILDKYHSILDDFSYDEDFVEILKNLNKDAADETAASAMNRSLSHLLRRNEKALAIALVTASGEWYQAGGDGWSEEVDEIALDGEKTFYLAGTQQEEDGETIHVLRIARPILDETGAGGTLGTIIMSIDQNVIWDIYSLRSHSRMYVTDGNGEIIAARDPARIGLQISELDREDHWIRSKKNQMTGWMVYDYYSTKEYGDVQASQKWLLTLTSIGAILMGMFLVYLLMRPLLRELDRLEDAMIRVGHGDFSVRLDQPGVLGQTKEIHAIVNGFNGMVWKAGELMEQVRTVAREQKEAELSAMEAQIDPHFLYNTLDTINWKAIECEEYEISGMLCALADILRYTIRNPGDTATVGQEFYWVEQYILLQRERLEQPLEVVTDVPEELKGYRMHKLLLQPFVENAIKHGMYQKEGPARLELRLRLVDEQLYFVIRDNGRGISPDVLRVLNDLNGELKGHVGILNVRKRLKLYYGDDAVCYFESRVGVGTTVHLFVSCLTGEQTSEGGMSN
ncbi:MAG: sensor histidine kinase [Clostridiales bacterium]|nr:sensor histidine kinase [Clostridiales bacterium]